MVEGLRPALDDPGRARLQDALGVLDGLEVRTGFAGRGLDAVDLVEVEYAEGLQDCAGLGLDLAGFVVGLLRLPWLIEDAMRAVLALADLPALVGRLLVRQPVGGGITTAKGCPPKG